MEARFRVALGEDLGLAGGAPMIVAISSGTARTAALLAAAGFFLLVGLQVLLALGAPLGRAAWGGGHDRLPRGLRVASAVSACVWVAAALVVLARAGFPSSPIPIGVARPGTWTLVGLLGLGALMNLASSSRWERFLMSSFALLLSVLCLVVALGG